MKATTYQRIYELWSSGQELLAGQELYEAIPNHKRPLWAGAMLRFSVQAAGLSLRPVNEVAEIAQDQARWSEAHAFQAVRTLSLATERKRSSDTYVALLRVAELAAKVTYNASGEPAPFDKESGARMARNFRTFVSTCENVSEHAAWKLLSAPEWRRQGSIVPQDLAVTSKS